MGPPFSFPPAWERRRSRLYIPGRHIAEKGTMAGGKVETGRLNIGGIELETVCRGAGNSLLLLHGFQTVDRGARFLDLLGEHGDIIAPSSPGFGNSPRPKNFDTVYDLVHLYLEVLD